MRAIAVLSVVTFHAFPQAIRSGFVGVDIFFVISGYLITSIILSGLATGRFSFTTFYARRIKRIFPALIVVLTFSLIVGGLVLLPDDFRRLGKHAAAGAGFVANFALWQEANYFDVASDTKILLHLWSLGIEEQFYLIWPALISLAWRLRLNRFTLVTAVLVVSLVYSLKATSTNPVAAFYSPAARFWELAMGASLAHLIISAPPAAVWLERRIATCIASALFERDSVDAERIYRDVLSTAGMALVLSSIFVITRRHEFPGWWALMPVVGAYLLILAGPRGWLNRWVLSNPIMVWFGLISYPLYLWHWPLLAFARARYGSQAPPTALLALLVVASVGLAWLTYRFVEKPIRFGAPRSWATPALACAMLVLGAFGVLDVWNNGFPGRIPQDQREYAAYFASSSPIIQAEHKEVGQDQCNFYNTASPVPTIAPRSGIDPECYTKHSDKSVLIIGDSNAADLYHGLKEVLPKDISVLMIYSSGCQVAPIHETALQTNHCEMAKYVALNHIRATPPDVLLMSSNNSYDIAYIRQFTALVKSYGVKHVLVLGQRPHWKPFLYKVVLDEYWVSTPRYIPGHQDDELLSFGRQFQAQLRPDEPFEFVDEMQPFCNAEGCMAYIGDDRREGLVTADTVHLRPFASVWLARHQLAPLIMKHIGD